MRQMIRNRDLFWRLTEPEHLRAGAFCRKLMSNRDAGDVVETRKMTLIK